MLWPSELSARSRTPLPTIATLVNAQSPRYNARVLDDKKILMRARKVIVSNWFDVQQVRIRVTRGVINVQGHIQKIGGTSTDREGSESSLHCLDADLCALPSCRGVCYELDNWIHESSGAWRRRRHKEAEPPRPLSPSGELESGEPKIRPD